LILAKLSCGDTTIVIIEISHYYIAVSAAGGAVAHTFGLL
jgi:hypothetical protein